MKFNELHSFLRVWEALSEANKYVIRDYLRTSIDRRPIMASELETEFLEDIEQFLVDNAAAFFSDVEMLPYINPINTELETRIEGHDTDAAYLDRGQGTW